MRRDATPCVDVGAIAPEFGNGYVQGLFGNGRVDVRHHRRGASPRRRESNSRAVVADVEEDVAALSDEEAPTIRQKPSCRL